MTTNQPVKILSIDFDYFQQTDIHTIQTCYPDGIDLTTELSTLVWSGYYANPKSKAKLEQVKILQKELNILKHILTSNENTKPNAPVLITNSHVHIYDFIHRCARQFHTDHINIINIDMHHDISNENPELDCGNWLSHIAEDFQDKCEISWICNPISIDCYSIEPNDALHLHTSVSTLQDCKFDAIFLCRSDNWLPPHLDIHFHHLVHTLQNRFRFISISDDVKHPRNIEPFIHMQTKILSQMDIHTT